MSVTAKQLSRSGARGKDLDAIVREQLQIIDDKLLRAERTWGRNVVTHDLPTAFALPGLDKKDAQRVVYSAILRSLDKREFEVRLLLDPAVTTVFIAWMTDLDIAEVEAMNALIKAKRINRDDVQTFVTLGAIPAPRTASAVRQGRAEPPAPLAVVEQDRVMRPRGGVGVADSVALQANPAPATLAETQLLRGT